MRLHYVYRITNTHLNKHYYGSRTTPANIDPKDDLGKLYFSSSSNEEFLSDQRINSHHYKYKIIRCFSDRKSALMFECRFHAKFNVGKNPNFYNKNVQSMDPGFIRCGESNHNFNKRIVRALNKDTGKKCVVPMDLFMSDHSLVGVTYGKINVIDKINHCRVWIHIKEFDPNRHEHQNYQKVTARNLKTGENGLIPSSIFHADPDWVGGTYGMVSAIDTITGEKVYVSKDTYRDSDHLISSNAGYRWSVESKNKLSAMREGMVTAKDINGRTFRVHASDLRFKNHEIAGITAYRYSIVIPGSPEFISLSLSTEFKNRKIAPRSYKFLLDNNCFGPEHCIVSFTKPSKRYPNTPLGWRIIRLD